MNGKLGGKLVAVLFVAAASVMGVSPAFAQTAPTDELPVVLGEGEHCSLNLETNVMDFAMMKESIAQQRDAAAAILVAGD